MSDKTSIGWTDATWNPVRGCSRVSAGCVNCYAENVAARFSGPGMAYEGLAKRVGGDARWTGVVRMVPEHLADPLRWQRPRRIFVNSMSDLFHEGLTFEEIAAVFGVMAAAPRHTFQVLTKRPRRALEFLRWATEAPADRLSRAVVDVEFSPFDDEAECWIYNFVAGWSKPKGIVDGNPGNGTVLRWPLPNVWLGVSAEDQATADERIPLLLQCPAAVRFVSYEPALAAVDFAPWLPCSCGGRRFVDDANWQPSDPFDGRRGPGDGLIPCGFCNEGGWDAEVCDTRPALDWIIVGGESGPGARPFDAEWARSTVEQCRAAGAACFVKQMGRWILGSNEGFGCVQVWRFPDGSAWVPPLIGARAFERPAAADGFQLTDRKGGNWNDWPASLRVREFPRRPPFEGTTTAAAGG